MNSTKNIINFHIAKQLLIKLLLSEKINNIEYETALRTVSEKLDCVVNFVL